LGDGDFRVFFFPSGVGSFAADFFFDAVASASGVSLGVGLGEASSSADFLAFDFADREGDLGLCGEILCFAAGVGDSSDSGVFFGFAFGVGAGEVFFDVDFLLFGFGVGDSSGDAVARALTDGVAFSSSSRCALAPTVPRITATVKRTQTKRRTATHANRARRVINPEAARLRH